MEGVESDRETVARYNTLRQELQNLADKIAELEMDADEHKLVIGALSPLPPSRKCWRRVGGVLVEETVGQTLPVLNTNLSGIEKASEGLREAWKKKDAELHQLEREKLSTRTSK